MKHLINLIREQNRLEDALARAASSLYTRHGGIYLVLVLVAAYSLVFIALHGSLGKGLLALSVLPVVLAAGLYGLRGGFVSSLLIFTVNLALIELSGVQDWEHMWRMTGAAGMFSILLTGIIVGVISDFGRWLWGRQARHRLTSILEATTDLVATLGPNGRLLYLNQAGRKMLGMTVLEDISVLHIRDIHPPQVGHDILETALPVALEKGAWSGESVFLTRSGVEIPASQVILAHKLGDGRLDYFSTISRDITEQKAAEEAEREQRVLAEALRDTAAALSGKLNFNQILDRILVNAERVVPYDLASIVLIDGDTGRTVRFRDISGRALTQRPFPVQLLIQDTHNLVHHLESSRPSTVFEFRSDPKSNGHCKPQLLQSRLSAPICIKGEVIGFLTLDSARQAFYTPTHAARLQVFADQAAVALENSRLLTEAELSYDSTIEGWSHALDLRDKETEGHTKRVTEMTVRLAREMGIPEPGLVHLRRGALLHDIGKMGISDTILLKPGPLSQEEESTMRLHPAYARDMLASIAFLQPALDIPFCHHEWWDGSGYPSGLVGEEIPLAARIFAVVDVWDALISDRPYRPAWPGEQAREYIRSQAGKQFDPQVVEVFLRSF